MKRIGLISDTHIGAGGRSLPSQIQDIFKGVDLILHAGDLTSVEVIYTLQSWGFSVVAVRGNMDLEGEANSLPMKRLLPIEGIKIGLIHGWGSPIGIRSRIAAEFLTETPDVIVFGHTHSPLVQEEDHILWVNPGSPTDRRFSPFRSVGILRLASKPSAEIIRL